MITLKGYYEEGELQELLFNGEIDHLSFVFHHSEEMKEDFFDYCSRNGLEKDEKAAQQFMRNQLKEEEDAHAAGLD